MNQVKQVKQLKTSKTCEFSNTSKTSKTEPVKLSQLMKPKTAVPVKQVNTLKPAYQYNK